jgi:hypothetical protein
MENTKMQKELWSQLLTQLEDLIDFDDEVYTKSQRARLEDEEAVLTTFHHVNCLLGLYAEEKFDQRPPGGSQKGRSPNIHREFERFHDLLLQDYFGENPRFPEHLFRRRFRMSSRLFLRILGDIEKRDEYFTRRKDALGKVGLSGLQKCTAVLRVLAYGTASDAADEYLKIGESTVDYALKQFCRSK